MSVPSRHSNPFASCWLQPSAAPLCVVTPEQAEELMGKLAQHRWRGAIVGPHGVGKSTLLESLVRLASPPKSIFRVEFHNGRTTHGWHQLLTAHLGPDTLVVVDGYEQLSVWQRWRLLCRTRSQRAGLLVTSHRPTLLPTLAELTPRLQVAQEIVRLLIAESSTPVTSADVDRAFCQHNGNLRDMLQDLYDLHERLIRAQPQANH